MSFTPQEIRHIHPPRNWLRGYSRKSVDGLLAEIAESLEVAYRERADLIERLNELEAETSKQSELEALLRSTLVSAERAAHDLKEQARRESDLMIREAQAEGRRITRESIAEKQLIEENTRTISAMLRSALDMLEATPDEVESGSEQLAPRNNAEETTEGGIRNVVA